MDVVKNIVEKMKKWDTLEAMQEDLDPYMCDVVDRIKTLTDQSIIYDYYLFKLIIIPNMKARFIKEFQHLCDLEKLHVKGYCDVVAEIMKLHCNSDMLNDVVEAHPLLSDREKDGIRRDWEKQHAIETKGDENVVVEDSKMRDDLKAKCDEIVNWKTKYDQVILQKKKQSRFKGGLECIEGFLSRDKIIRLAQPSLLDERKQQVQSMMAEDNSCSSTLAKKCGDSSEDKTKDNSCSSTQAKKWGDSSEDNASSDRLTHRAGSTARLDELKTLIGRADSDLRDLSIRRKDVEDELSVVTSKLDLILQSITQLKSEKSAFEDEYTNLINVDPPSDDLVLSDLL